MDEVVESDEEACVGQKQRGHAEREQDPAQCFAKNPPPAKLFLDQPSHHERHHEHERGDPGTQRGHDGPSRHTLPLEKEPAEGSEHGAAERGHGHGASQTRAVAARPSTSQPFAENLDGVARRRDDREQ